MATTLGHAEASGETAAHSNPDPTGQSQAADRGGHRGDRRGREQAQPRTDSVAGDPGGGQPRRGLLRGLRCPVAEAGGNPAILLSVQPAAPAVPLLPATGLEPANARLGFSAQPVALDAAGTDGMGGAAETRQPAAGQAPDP